jgi:hypothetical protein
MVKVRPDIQPVRPQMTFVEGMRNVDVTMSRFVMLRDA